MRVVIIGAEGQLGSDLVRAFQGEDIVPLSENDVDIVNINKLKEIISSESPDLVINTAAFSNVPQCEREPDRALRVNAIGARNVAIVTGEIKSLHLYISTDYVFDGEKGKPYLEDDSTAPVNTYGLSKLAGEYYVRYILDRYFIVRTSGLYGIHRCISKGTNFVDKMLELRDRDSIKIVTDEVLTPTYTLHLAKQIYKLVSTDSYGIYHVTNEGECSWYDFAKAIFKEMGFDVNLVPINSSKFQTNVKRPKYSVLENSKLKTLGLNNMPHWRDSLRAYLAERVNKAL